MKVLYASVKPYFDMYKFSIVSSILVSLLFASSAFAQSYTGSCITLTQDLTVGARSSDVLPLQNFLVNQNYPGGGSWMLTGYVGQATAQALRNFQSQQGLQTTGALDVATRSAISRVSCGGNYSSSYGANNTYNDAYAYPYTTNYNYNTGTGRNGTFGKWNASLL